MASTKFPKPILLAGVLALCAAPAAAQMYPGAEVIVNPAAIGGSQVLRYPDGRYVRVLPPLLQPGATSPLAPVHLHPPGTREARHARRPARVVRRKAPSEETAAAEAAPAAQPAGPPADAAPSQSGEAAIPFSFGGTPSAPARPARKAAAPQGEPARKPEAVASVAPARVPRAEPVHGLVKQAAILFDENSSELSDTSQARLKDMTASLNQALLAGADRVELVGYGGNPGDKSSNARRLSLKRALAIREALIVDGLPAGRIDVRALGGVGDDGPTDRVDIFVKG